MQIEQYLRRLEQLHGDVLEVFSLGKSFEGRDIVAAKISWRPEDASASASANANANANGTGSEPRPKLTAPDKPGLLIDAGIHAREWIAPTTALYAVHQLVREPANRHILRHVDVFVVPVLNPDGYEYTHLNQTVSSFIRFIRRSLFNAARDLFAQFAFSLSLAVTLNTLFMY